MGEKWSGSYYPKAHKSQTPPRGLFAKWPVSVIELLSVLHVYFRVDSGKLLKGPNGLRL